MKNIIFACIVSMGMANNLKATSDSNPEAVHRSPHPQNKEIVSADRDLENNFENNNTHQQLYNPYKPSAPIKVACGVCFITMCAALGAYAHMN